MEVIQPGDEYAYASDLANGLASWHAAESYKISERVVSFGSMLVFRRPAMQKVLVNLNPDYSAEVRSDAVYVRCGDRLHKFEFAPIRQLANEVRKIQEKAQK